MIEPAHRKDRAVWFIAPWLVGFALMYGVPLLYGCWLALTDWDGIAVDKAAWIGTDNFAALLDDDRFLRALENSLRFSVLNVFCQLLLALWLAMVVRHARRRGWWATVFYVPHLLSGVATWLVWAWLLNPSVGPVNRILAATLGIMNDALAWIGPEYTLQIELPLWLYSPDAARPALVLMNLWRAGGPMLIFLAALLRTNPAIEEAAMLDGAGRGRRFFSITMPQLLPALVFNVLTVFVASMQHFEAPYLLSNWSQNGALQFATLEIYQTAFERQRFSYALAQSIGLMVLLTIFCVGALLTARRFVRYDFSTELSG